MSRKWYWSLFTNILDICLTNSYILWKFIYPKDKHTLLSFKRAIAQSYLKSGDINKLKRKYASTIVPEPLRYDSIGHWPMKRSKQQRCQGTTCNAKPLTYCSKCKVTLCLDCFTEYHLVTSMN